MKKLFLTSIVAVTLLLSMVLAGCTTVYTIEKDFGFSAEDITAVQVSRGVVTKASEKPTKVTACYDALKTIEFVKYDGKKQDSDWEKDFAYKVSFNLKDSEGSYQMCVLLETNAEGKQTARVGFRELDGFKHKGVKTGWYSLGEEQSVESLVSVMDKIFVNVM